MSLEAGEFELKKKEFRIDDLLSNVLELIVMHAAKKRLILNLEQEDDLPERINSDERRIEQVLLTLLVNAVKYTPKDKKITLRVMHDQQDPQMILFQVTDEGLGMSLEKKVELFKLFGGKNSESTDPKDKQRSRTDSHFL
jgi:two-component system sensor histidine kinase/response regulator